MPSSYSTTSLDDVGTLPHHSLLALVWTSFSGSFLFIVLRTAIRFKVARRMGPEDYWMFLALATLLTLCILETVQLPSLYYVTAVIAGAIPLSENLISETENYLKFEFAIIILFWTTLWCVKSAFLALYYNLFRDLKLYRRVWFVLAGFTFLAYVGCIVTLCLSCGPVANFFGFETCGSTQDIWLSNISVYYGTSVDIFTDLCIMAMPIRLIYNVKISPKQKLGLVCVFGLCFVMISFAIIRAKQVLVPQYFVNLTLLMVWSTLAASVSVIVGSLPALKLLITSRASTKRSRYGSSNGGNSRKYAKQQLSHRSDFRGKDVPLGSISSDKKSPGGRYPDGDDSQEDILQSDGARFVMVKHDVDVSYSEVERPLRPIRPHGASEPLPVYQDRRPIIRYDRPF